MYPSFVELFCQQLSCRACTVVCIIDYDLSCLKELPDEFLAAIGHLFAQRDGFWALVPYETTFRRFGSCWIDDVPSVK